MRLPLVPGTSNPAQWDFCHSPSIGSSEKGAWQGNPVGHTVVRK